MYLPYELKLPLPINSYEYFSPPLPYLFPALIQVICRNLATSPDLVEYCQPIYGKATQIFQTVLYLLTLIFYMKALKILLKQKSTFNLSFLLIFSLITVNYRTFLMLRGEPYIAFLLSVLVYLFIKNNELSWKITKKQIFLFSFVVGFIGISRQWGLLLLPAFLLVLFFLQKELKKDYFKFMFIVFLISMTIILPFYLNLYLTTGSVTSFNKDPQEFNLNNQSLSFYLPINDEAINTFRKPIRSNMDNQLFPILYSDLWGDYWGYFSFISKNVEKGRNQINIGDYLARVNILSIFTTFIFFLGYINIKKNYKNNIVFRYIKYSILFTFFGYMWFLIKYPEIPTGDTIKATYILQLFHLLAFSAAIYLEKLKDKSKKNYMIIISILIIIFTHNFSAMLSHF